MTGNSYTSSYHLYIYVDLGEFDNKYIKYQYQPLLRWRVASRWTAASPAAPQDIAGKLPLLPAERLLNRHLRVEKCGFPQWKDSFVEKTSTIAIENGTHHDSVCILYIYMIIHTLVLDNLMITSWQHHKMMITVERTTGSSPLKGWPNHVCCPNAEWGEAQPHETKIFNSKNLSYYELSYLNFHLIFYLSLFKSLWVGRETFSVWNFWCLNSLNLSFLQGPPLVLPVLPKD